MGIKRTFNLITTSPVAIAITVFIVVTIIVISLSFKYYSSGFGENVLVEAHGMLFDILVIGILILYLNRLSENRIRNQRYLDEIDDFRSWKSDEAAHRIAGNVRRLNKNRFKNKINLRDCYLKDINLKGAKLERVNLRLADLRGANLEGANLWGANLERTNIQGANLEGANLWGANLKGANLEDANLRLADLERASLVDANLEGASFWSANFLCTGLSGANLEGAKGLTIEQLSKVVTLYKTKLDPELMEQVIEKYPNLLEKPKFR